MENRTVLNLARSIRPHLPLVARGRAEGRMFAVYTVMSVIASTGNSTSDLRLPIADYGGCAVILGSALSSCARAEGVWRGRPSARQSRRPLEVVQGETADVDRAGNEDVTNEDESERRLSGGELFAEVLEMKSRRL